MEMEFDITKMVEEVVMRVKENQEEFIFETIQPYCEKILQTKINKEELKQILLNGIRKQQPCEDVLDKIRTEIEQIADEEQKSSESKADYWENRYLNLKQKYSWIPCDKKMPQTEVLCCDTYGEVFIGYVFKDDESETGYSAESNESFLYDCVAWMPLPEPYRESEDKE